ncbi:MAG: LysR family transcriptional regulator [Piscinibacter sp.]|uniref:LysR family transcriptional regulator n=1 Tax=Piscinibacter sp. TaxID=1903157 RepID=UPI001B752743|nr:LysR family transcriptional regulator [Piscinibacter sp.]MBP5989436.1 LysR family transcriptional regulator [Piscinibacter sp.]MBP6027303.1 LysR family transcriptional regulator [Piscinibacter sp.]
MASLLAYTAFARAYELGSFSAVARELGLTQSTVSKHIAALEAGLGVQLFARTTRKLNPTHEAALLYEGVQHLLDAADAIQSSLGGPRAEPSGLLRLTMPDSYGRSQLMPRLARFLARFPKVRLDVRLTDNPINLIEEGMELGVRIGELSSSTLVARPLGIVEHLIVATPKYLATRGEPHAPTDLARCNCIVYTGAAKGHRWVFESEQGRQVVDVPSSLGLNSADAMYSAVLSDVGIAKLPAWIVGNDVESGRLRALLPEYYPMPMPINIVYPQTRVLSARARCFIDFLLAEMQGGPGSHR